MVAIHILSVCLKGTLNATTAKGISIEKTAPDIEIKTPSKQLKTMNAKPCRLSLCWVSYELFIIVFIFVVQTEWWVYMESPVCVFAHGAVRWEFLLLCILTANFRYTDDSTNKFQPHPQWLMIASFCLFVFAIVSLRCVCIVFANYSRIRIVFANTIRIVHHCLNYSLERDSNVKINNDTCVICSDNGCKKSRLDVLWFSRMRKIRLEILKVLVWQSQVFR